MSHPSASPDFWHERWNTQRIGFHQPLGHPALREHWASLEVPDGAPVLVPLCGKTRDMAWLAAAGHPVVGVELSPVACEAFFAESEVTPERDTLGPFTRWRAGKITLLQGDVFALPQVARISTFGAVYDRAALIALPLDLRDRYARMLSGAGSTLLVTMAYDATKRDGPPFSVSDDEVRTRWPNARLLAQSRLDEPGWSDIGGVTESFWAIQASS